jgi:DNA-directed RNA polymerase subunit RPC12/RpoP
MDRLADTIQELDISFDDGGDDMAEYFGGHDASDFPEPTFEEVGEAVMEAAALRLVGLDRRQSRSFIPPLTTMPPSIPEFPIPTTKETPVSNKLRLDPHANEMRLAIRANLLEALGQVKGAVVQVALAGNAASSGGIDLDDTLAELHNHLVGKEAAISHAYDYIDHQIRDIEREHGAICQLCGAFECSALHCRDCRQPIAYSSPGSPFAHSRGDDSIRCPDCHSKWLRRPADTIQELDQEDSIPF